MRILIAEDDPGSRLVLVAATRHLGHEVVAARDGQEAWRLYGLADFDVVISDRSMPQLDGIELCTRIRRHSGGGYTYFIFLTSLSEKESIVDGMTAGADDYLAKPLDREELWARLVVAERISGLYSKLEKQKREVELLNRMLFEQSRTDPLTQLGNRLKLAEDLDRLVGSKRNGSELHCLVLCDIDHFKAFNDSYGHLAGDDVLTKVAGGLAAGCGADDRAYRYGGEEFLLLLRVNSIGDGYEKAERQRRLIEERALPHLASPRGHLTISVGVSLVTSCELDIAQRVEDADQALYVSKKTGRNKVTIAGADQQQRRAVGTGR